MLISSRSTSLLNRKLWGRGKYLVFHVLSLTQPIPKTLVVVACALRISCILLGVDTTVPKLDLFDMLLVAYRFHSSSECLKCGRIVHHYANIM